MPASSALPASEPTTGRGIASMLLAVVVFSTMDALIKWLAPFYPVMEIVFFRSLFGLVPLLPAILRQGRAAVRTRRPLGQAGRALAGLGATACFFYAYRFLPLADVFGIAFAAPLFVTALSVLLLRERVGIRRWSAVSVGFVGVLIMVRPGAGIADPATLLTLLGTVLYALTLIFIRDLGKTESTTSIVFYTTCTITLASALALPFGWVTPDARDLALLVLIGLMGGVGQLAITRAFRLAPAAVVAPFDYTALPYAAALGYFIWDDVPEPIFLLGAVIVIGSGLYILHRETRVARLPPPAASLANEG
jgi:drug/metabolite transporter (DMT)-like permease